MGRARKTDQEKYERVVMYLPPDMAEDLRGRADSVAEALGFEIGPGLVARSAVKLFLDSRLIELMKLAGMVGDKSSMPEAKELHLLAKDLYEETRTWLA